MLEKGRPHKPPFKVVHQFHSADTVDTLVFLLNEAVAGNILGLAFSAARMDRRIDSGITGEYLRNPGFAVGSITELFLSTARSAYPDVWKDK